MGEQKKGELEFQKKKYIFELNGYTLQYQGSGQTIKSINLTGSIICENAKDNKVFSIKTSNRLYILKAPNEQEKNEWVDAILDTSGDGILQSSHCPDHNEAYTLFCSEDNTLVCKTCLSTRHYGHKGKPILDMLKNDKFAPKKMLRSIKKSINQLTTSMVDVQKEEIELNTVESKIKTEINQYIDNIVSLIEIRRSDLLNSLNTMVENKKKKLKDKSSIMSTRVTKLSSKRRQLNQLIQKGTNSDESTWQLAPMCIQIHQKLQEQAKLPDIENGMHLSEFNRVLDLLPSLGNLNEDYSNLSQERYTNLERGSTYTRGHTRSMSLMSEGSECPDENRDDIENKINQEYFPQLHVKSSRVRTKAIHKRSSSMPKSVFKGNKMKGKKRDSLLRSHRNRKTSISNRSKVLKHEKLKRSTSHPLKPPRRRVVSRKSSILGHDIPNNTTHYSRQISRSPKNYYLSGVHQGNDRTKKKKKSIKNRQSAR